MALHKKVKELTDRKQGIKTNTGCVNSKDDQLLFEKQAVADRWVEYIKELYDDIDRGQKPETSGDSGPSILKDEVEAAIRKMKSGKAPGVDNILTEHLKALNSDTLQILTDILNLIYSTGSIPDDLVKSIFITLP